MAETTSFGMAHLPFWEWSYVHSAGTSGCVVQWARPAVASRRRDMGDADDNGERREQLRHDIWALCTLFTVMFVWKVATAMPSLPTAAVVWAMDGGCIVLVHHCP